MKVIPAPLDFRARRDLFPVDIAPGRRKNLLHSLCDFRSDPVAGNKRYGCVM